MISRMGSASSNPARPAVTTRPLRTWINRAGLGELDYPVWVQPEPTPVIVAPAPPKPPALPPGPVLLGSPPGGGYTWQLPDGSTVTTPTSDPPRPLYTPPPPRLLYGDDMLFAPQVCPPLCGPGGSVGLPPGPGAWEAQTPSPPPPAAVAPLMPPSSPGTLPAGGYVIAPNFSDPAAVGGPFSTTQTTVVAGLPAAPAMSPWVIVGVAVLGVMMLGGE